MTPPRPTWKTLCRQLDELKRRHKGKKYRAPFPDLSVPQVTARMSNTIPKGHWTPPRKEAVNSNQFAVGTPHKQGPMMITDGMLGDLAHLGGKKP